MQTKKFCGSSSAHKRRPRRVLLMISRQLCISELDTPYSCTSSGRILHTSAYSFVSVVDRQTDGQCIGLLNIGE